LRLARSNGLVVPSWAIRPQFSYFLHPAYAVDQFTRFRIDGRIWQFAVVAVAFDGGLTPSEQQAVVFVIWQTALVEQTS
jgi:hypothetical protein